MNFQTFKTLVNSIDGGKKLPNAIYLHKDALPDISNELTEYISSIENLHKIKKKNWNICKVARRDFRISFLHYPSFNTYPYPALATSYSVNLSTGIGRNISYEKSDNPPILHRRESFFVTKNELTKIYSLFTQEGEVIGLYENTKTIGLKEQWLRLIKRKGYYLDEEGHLHRALLHRDSIPSRPNPNDSKDSRIDRHKTALHRDKLSAPMFSLQLSGLLDGDHSVLDYGCGNGDDVRELSAHGIDVIGWDPVYAPDVVLKNADIVNLGFVLNVIEDKTERQDTLVTAFKYTRKALLVSVMLGNEKIISKFRPYKDGVITQRNTFQKYFEQSEIKLYIESVLDQSTIAIGPGRFLIFKDSVLEQLYFVNKSRTKYSWKKLTYRKKEIQTSKLSRDFLEVNRSLIEHFWQTCLELARLPGNDEFEHSEQLRHVAGSHQKAFEYCSTIFDESEFNLRRIKRKEDLSVYFALSYFSKRPTFNRMPLSFQRDIKEFFVNYSDAREHGKNLLFQIPEVNDIYKACISANDSLPASVLNGQHDIIFHKQHLNTCPPLLRVYVGCALQLYGSLDEIDLIKVHIASGKVTLMGHDDWDKDIPHMTERIKINLRHQKIEFFDYVEPFRPPPLIDKFKYI